MKILAISDMHGYLPEIPECDLLIIAGDICPDMSNIGHSALNKQWFWMTAEFTDWYESLKAKKIVATWGNHDFVGEEHPDPRVTVDELVEYEGLKIWLTPWVTNLPRWAFNKDESGLVAIYEQIPEGIDILVTHAPPYGYGDIVPGWGHVGGVELGRTVERVKPKAVICGHIHPAYGKYDMNSIPVYNVACVDDNYDLVRGATEIVL